MQSIPWYLDDKVVTEIIRGVQDAVEEKQKQYNVTTKVGWNGKKSLSIVVSIWHSFFPESFPK